jgi:uncharacterized SAM-binding protein YcdF (DUF218 family)
VIAELIARLWAVKDYREYAETQIVDLIVPVSHGATRYTVTNGVRVTTKRSLAVIKDHPEARVMCGSFSSSPDYRIEEYWKRSMFKLLQVTFVGRVINTIEECSSVRQMLPAGVIPRSIVVCTDHAHSRRAKIVWKTFFPDSKVIILSDPIEQFVDKESPMASYHSLWKILFWQIGPTPYFWYLSKRGAEYMDKQGKKYHQPIAK